MTVIDRGMAPGCGCDAPAGLIGIDAALERIAGEARPVAAPEPVPLAHAAGRVLARPVRARGMTPPFDNAAMDGYAVATAAFVGAGPWTFPVTARVPAGRAGGEVDAHGVARIFTGAPVPAGADAVVPQEDVSRSGKTVTFAGRPEPGWNVRRAGSDMMPGRIVVPAGARLGPREVAACAAAGVGSVDLRPALRVALLVTGTEIRDAGTGRGQARIWDVNTPMLSAALAAPRIDLAQVEQVPDDRGALEEAVSRAAARADLIVTTGGVSVGEEDHVKAALTSCGGRIGFAGVAIKPGKPVCYGRLGRAHWLGLPGNPLSAFVTWALFGTALVRGLTGEAAPRAPRRHVVTAEAIRRKPGRCEVRPATLIGFDPMGREVASFEDATHSARVGNLPVSDGLIFLPAEADYLPASALVDFQPFCDN